MTLAFITTPALLVAAIAGTGALLGGAIIWARNRQRKATLAAAARGRDRMASTAATGGRRESREH
jgi:hypothetical protein